MLYAYLCYCGRMEVDGFWHYEWPALPGHAGEVQPPYQGANFVAIEASEEIDI